MLLHLLYVWWTLRPFELNLSQVRTLVRSMWAGDDVRVTGKYGGPVHLGLGRGRSMGCAKRSRARKLVPIHVGGYNQV